MRHVVVVGNGMTGSRFAEELLSRDGTDGFRVTVLGDEEHEPYNRVLLSNFVAGSATAATLHLPVPRHPRLSIERGAAVTALDRTARTVTTATGSTHHYDVLVFATGAAARMLALPGVAVGRAAPGVHVLRSLDDARAICAASGNARHIVVVGAGVLGVEVATGLASRHAAGRAPGGCGDCAPGGGGACAAGGARPVHGALPGDTVATDCPTRTERIGVADVREAREPHPQVPPTVTLVHAAGEVMERQLGVEASSVAVAALARAGVRCELSAHSTAVERRGGVLAGLHLADGRVLPCDMLVLACGTIPRTDVAAASGLPCGPGITVGDDLASPDDPRVFAIGDCATPPEGGTGLIAQGWEQARWLAQHLLHRDDPAVGATRAGAPAGTRMDRAGGTDVVRVKSALVDIVAMGRSRAAAGSRTLRLADPSAGRFVEVTVNADRLVGATCIGAPGVAADLVARYTRGTPLPADPAQLLLRAVAATTDTTGSPTAMPEGFGVCRCNGATKGDIMRAWSAGARTRPEVAAMTRATTGCGGCADLVGGILEWLRAGDPDPQPSTPARDPARPTRDPARPTRDPSRPATKHRADELTPAKQTAYRPATSPR